MGPMASMIPEGVAPAEWNKVILEAAQEQNWLNADQLKHCRAALAKQPEESVIAIITVNAWLDRKSTRLNSSHSQQSRMPSSA